MTTITAHQHADIASHTADYIPLTVSTAIMTQCHALGIPAPEQATIYRAIQHPDQTAAEPNIWQTCRRTADRIVRLFHGRGGQHPDASEIATATANGIAAITPAPTPGYADIIAHNVAASEAWTLPPETGSDA